MRKIGVLLMLSLLFIGCKQKINESDLTKINGYWEIEKAELPDGSKKEYTVNPTIDFIEIKGKKGFRKKVMPQMDGSYLMNNVSEKIEVTNTDGTVVLHYSTSYAKWKEEVLEVSNERLVIRNDQDLEYTYKRPKPFSVK